MTTKKVGLALGGGAARGFAHVGVLKAFKKYGVPIHCIAGTSAGAIVGGLYAAGLSIPKMVEVVSDLSWRNFARFTLSRKSLVSSEPLSRFVKDCVGDVTMGDLNLPFYALATNVLTGEGCVLKEPDLPLDLVLRASSSFPGVYQPIEIKGQYFMDGGAAKNVPTSLVRDMGADLVVAVDVIPHIELGHLPRHVATLIDRGLDLLLHAVSQKMIDEADFVFRPVNVPVNSFQVKKARLLIELGEKAVDDNIDSFRAILNH